jgi:hypothetical protein
MIRGTILKLILKLINNINKPGSRVTKYFHSIAIGIAAIATVQLQSIPMVQAGTIRHDRVAPGINDPANPHIQLANQPQFDSVGRLIDNLGNPVNGVFIGNDWVLTAAHIPLGNLATKSIFYWR